MAPCAESYLRDVSGLDFPLHETNVGDSEETEFGKQFSDEGGFFTQVSDTPFLPIFVSRLF